MGGTLQLRALGCGLQLGALAWLAGLSLAGDTALPHLLPGQDELVLPLILGAWLATTLPVFAGGTVALALRRREEADCLPQGGALDDRPSGVTGGDLVLLGLGLGVLTLAVVFGAVILVLLWTATAPTGTG